MRIALEGILQSAQPAVPPVLPYRLSMFVSEAVSGLPEYQTSWDDVFFTKILNTTGSQTTTGKLKVQAGENVTVVITRTGLAADIVNIDYTINGVAYGATDVVSAGDPVSVSKTFLIGDIAPDDLLAVIITEG